MKSSTIAFEMTIEISVKTGSAVVFAADSKVTTSAITGYGEDGDLIWADQTYDNGVKLVHDKTARVMAMVAGHANVGLLAATDVISRLSLGGEIGQSLEQQDAEIAHFVGRVVEQKTAYWETTEVEHAKWPGPMILLACSAVDGITPRVWRADLRGEGVALQEILKSPGIETEGSYDEVFTLLYGFDGAALSSICNNLGVTIDQWAEAFKNAKVLRPIDKLNLWSMPVQDAIDLAVFLATVQVEMDRFLPGTPACGGAIDVMVLQMAPEPAIKTYPGKALHHPHLRGRLGLIT